MLIMLIFSIGSNLYMYWNSDKMVLQQYKAKEVNENTAPALYNLVKNLVDRAKMPMPKVYIIDDAVPNAFATGRDKNHAVVAVTTALANVLNKDEIEGVIAHELSHIRHNDILIGTIAASMAGVVATASHYAMWFGSRRRDNKSQPRVTLLVLLLAPIMATIIQLAVSRSREYLADEGGGELCGNPNHLADALLKIQGYASKKTMNNATAATAHMFIMIPFSAKDAQKMFSTHPSTEERVALLRKQADQMRAKGELTND